VIYVVAEITLCNVVSCDLCEEIEIMHEPTISSVYNSDGDLSVVYMLLYHIMNLSYI